MRPLLTGYSRPRCSNPTTSMTTNILTWKAPRKRQQDHVPPYHPSNHRRRSPLMLQTALLRPPVITPRVAPAPKQTSRFSHMQQKLKVIPSTRKGHLNTQFLATLSGVLKIAELVSASLERLASTCPTFRSSASSASYWQSAPTAGTLARHGRSTLPSRRRPSSRC